SSDQFFGIELKALLVKRLGAADYHPVVTKQESAERSRGRNGPDVSSVVIPDRFDLRCARGSMHLGSLGIRRNRVGQEFDFHQQVGCESVVLIEFENLSD